MNGNDIIKNIFASSSTVATAVIIFNPLDCLRIRWQVFVPLLSHNTINSNINLITYTKNIIKNEGLCNGLWLPGVVSNACGGAISRGIGMGFYPTIRDKLSEYNGTTEKNTFSMFTAGLISGSIGYWLSTPFWVVKTRIQASKEISKYSSISTYKYKNMFDTFSQTYRCEGVKGLYRGSSCLAVRGALMNSGNTLGYDGTKTIFKKYELFSNYKEGPILHITASFFAALLSSTLSIPADVLMTRYQTQIPKKHNLINFSRILIRKEGIRTLFSGWIPLFIRVLPIYCLYLPCYEQVRLKLGLGYL